MRKRLNIIGMIALATVMVAASATTAGATDEVTDRREVSVRSHKVWARGTGQVALEATGWVLLSIRGNVVIADEGGNASVHIQPRTDDTAENDRAELAPTTTYTLNNFDGVVWVRGSDFTVTARGKVRRLRTDGSGTVQLAGSGRWFTKHLHGGWPMTVTYGAVIDSV